MTALLIVAGVLSPFALVGVYVVVERLVEALDDRRARRRVVHGRLLDDVSLEEARRRLREPESRVSRRTW